MRDAGFSMTRAVRIARTETTRALNGGTATAYRKARAEGVQLRRMWLSARDEAVRPEHWALDGQVREVDEPFVVPAAPGVNPRLVGEKGDAPGDFGPAALVVNCRCTLVPVLDDSAPSEPEPPPPPPPADEEPIGAPPGSWLDGYGGER